MPQSVAGDTRAFADAIRPDTGPGMEKWIEFNRTCSAVWPVIITRKDPLPEAAVCDGQSDKMALFLPNPGEGS